MSRKRKSARPPAPGTSASQADSSHAGSTLRPHEDAAAPAIYGLFFLLLFLACSPALDSKFALPKAIVLSAGVCALGILLMVRNWRGQGAAPPRWALPLSLALGIWWLVSTPFALHLPTALDGVYDYYNGLWTHLCWLALFVASVSLPCGLRTVRRIAALLAAAIVPVALINIAETTGLSSLGLKEVSTLGDRIAAGALMNFAIPFAAIALLRVRRWGAKAVLAGLLALLVISEFLSQGRGPWMGLVAAAFVLTVGMIRSKAGWKVVAAMLLGMVMLGALTAKLSPTVAARLATLTQIAQDENIRQRFVHYRAALRALREHPVAGIGFENFQNSYPAYRSAEDIYFFDNVIPTMVHNGYLQTALTNGIPALLLYLALVAGVLIKLVRELRRNEDRDRQDLLLGFLAALAAYLVQDLVGWLDMALTSTFWVMLGLALNLASENAPRAAPSWTRPVLAGFSGLMLLLSLYLFYDRYARVIADANLFKAQALDVRRQWPDAEILVGKAVLSLPGDSRTEMIAGQLYAQRFVALQDQRAYARGRELLEASYTHNRYERMRLVNIVALESAALELGQISAASDFAQKAIAALAQTDSDNAAFHEFKARFFGAQGRFDAALEAIREARRLAPQEDRFRSREAEYQARVKG